MIPDRRGYWKLCEKAVSEKLYVNQRAFIARI
jgi:hypothetical protein